MSQMNKTGKHIYAGRHCDQKLSEGRTCNKYARVEIGTDKSAVYDRITCQAHVMEAVRSVWQETGEAAYIREIPGMWRDPRD